MLFISIILCVWFVLWSFFAYQRHEMLLLIVNLLMSIGGFEDDDEEE